MDADARLATVVEQTLHFDPAQAFLLRIWRGGSLLPSREKVDPKGPDEGVTGLSG